MKEKAFVDLPIGPKKYELGECFLEGNALVNQKGNKKPGEWVTYLKIITVHPNQRIEYIPVTEKLEEDYE